MMFRVSFIGLRGLAVAAAVLLAGSGCARRSEPVRLQPTTAPGDTRTEAPADPSSSATANEDDRTLELMPVFFGFDSHVLDARAREVLDRQARLLRDRPGQSVTIEGHCDERGTVEYNIALGERRALAVRDYLVTAGVPEERIHIVSYGKERPFEPGRGEAAWAANRRAHFVAR